MAEGMTTNITGAAGWAELTNLFDRIVNDVSDPKQCWLETPHSDTDTNKRLHDISATHGSKTPQSTTITAKPPAAGADYPVHFQHPDYDVDMPTSVPDYY